MSKRTFTKQEKMSVLKEASGQGVTKTLKIRYLFGYLYSWKEKFADFPNIPDTVLKNEVEYALNRKCNYALGR